MVGVAKQMKVAVIGATTFLGREVLKAMDESELLLVEPVLLTSGEGVGEMLTCQGADVTADNIEDADFKGVDVALFCGDDDLTKKYAPKAMAAGAMVLDASGGLREKGVLLAGAEPPNPEKLKKQGGVLPEPLAQSLAMVLGAITEKHPVAEATASTYQTVASAGMGAVEEVAQQSIGLLGGGATEGGFSGDLFAHQAAFNVLPHVGQFKKDGQTTTEEAITTDFGKLQGGFPISVSCAYVPTFVGDAVDISLRFKAENAPEPADIRDLFSPASGVMVLDDVAENEYATPYGAAETSYVFVSRVRRDPAFKNGLRLWLVADHLRVAQARKLVKYTEALAHQVQ